MDDRLAALENFRFRSIHPSLFFGTASDRYSDWPGQIYSRDRYEGRLNSRTKSLDGKTYNETLLPVDSAKEYFEHFSLLEIDFTFSHLIDGMMSPDMVEDTVEIVRGEVKAGRRVYLIVNNRSGGNAPQIARLIAERVAEDL